MARMMQPTSLLVGKSAEGTEGKPQLVGFLTITSRVGPDEHISIVRIIINIL
jgi:hypothetical protein